MATTKDFDCIAFKRSAQEKIYAQIQGMTPAEEVAWFRRKVDSGPYRELWRHIANRDQKADSINCSEHGIEYGDTSVLASDMCIQKVG